MIRSVLATVVFMLLYVSLAAQAKTSRYCEVSFDLGRHLPGLKIDSSLADGPLQYADTSLAGNNDVDILRKRGSMAAVLNYMAARGWTLVCTTFAGLGGVTRYFYFVKKYE